VHIKITANEHGNSLHTAAVGVGVVGRLTAADAGHTGSSDVSTAIDDVTTRCRQPGRLNCIAATWRVTINSNGLSYLELQKFVAYITPDTCLM